MANPLSLAPGAVNQPRPTVLYGQVATTKPAPSSFSNPLYVVFPQWQPDQYVTFTNWPACHGSTLPAQGAAVVVVVDTTSTYRCVWWDSASTTFAATSISGLAASGDLTGAYPNPTVAKVQGRTVTSTAPSPGQSLVWNGSAWAPTSSLGANTVARAYRNTALTLTASTWTKIPLDTKSFDPGSCFDITTNYRYNVPATGYYQVNLCVEITDSGTGTYTQMLIACYKNGTVVFQTNEEPAVQSVFSTQASDIVQCNAGDYLELWAWNSQGTALALASAVNFMSLVQVA